MDHLVFAKKLVSELISRTPRLRFDLQDAYDQYVMLLYASLIEIAHSISTLVEHDATVATKTITRGMLEAWVDFINLIDDPAHAEIVKSLDKRLTVFFDKYSDKKYDLWKGGTAKGILLEKYYGRDDILKSRFPNWREPGLEKAAHVFTDME